MTNEELDLMFGQNWIGQLQDVRKREDFRPISELRTNFLSPSDVLLSATLCPSTEQIRNRFRVRRTVFMVEMHIRKYFLTR